MNAKLKCWERNDAATHPDVLRRLTAQYLFLSLLFFFSTAAIAETKIGEFEDCNTTEFQSILSKSELPTQNKARAVWLNATSLRWPGIKNAGQFKLYFSESGKIQISDKKRVTAFDGALSLKVSNKALAKDIMARFNYVTPGPQLDIAASDHSKLRELHTQQVLLVQENRQGEVLDFSAIQLAGALDDLYASADNEENLGVTLKKNSTQFKLWAPTAQNVRVCVYAKPGQKAQSVQNLSKNTDTGIWAFEYPVNLEKKYYKYVMDVFVQGVGLVRNRVTDPYSISLSSDSTHSYIANLDSEDLKPKHWDKTVFPNKVKHQTDMVIYELHVRDFSISDASVSKNNRGKYTAFTETNSKGMQHLIALSKAGLTDIHLLPVFDLATVPEKNCAEPDIEGTGSSEKPQAIIEKYASTDCFNWGYDPYHFNAPEGSYSTHANDGATRIIEFRRMVQALHQLNLRVGMDVVYNHTTASGQHEKSVLDRIVPGYYQRLNADGVVERSTCCDNTATENMMMAKLMRESVVLWAKHYKIDSFRFDLMGHQPRKEMERTLNTVNIATGRDIQFIGEGWNFGEVANGKRFIQASQLSLNGSGIGTFSDRARDAIRGGNAGDGKAALVERQGYINGLGYDANEANIGKNLHSDLLHAAALVRVGLAGSLRDYKMLDDRGRSKSLETFAYGDQAAGYVSQPGEVVNYVDNHDNQTLFDINAYKLPVTTSKEDRARVQVLGMALNAFSQGIAYFHAGIETLRSKSMDGNSYDSGDWFNRLDWRLQDNYFATGLPPKRDNGHNHEWITPRLNNALIKPDAEHIRFSRDAFLDLLKIRDSSSLFRLQTAEQIKQRLTFYNLGPTQNPVLIVGHLKGRSQGKRLAGANFDDLLYLVNVDKTAQRISIDEEAGKQYVLHPVHLADKAADTRPAKAARYDKNTGTFFIPARTALVFVTKEGP